jgi:outer membrane protein assembly factor BamE (lipoprotein component of BamABCDE complex)
MSIGNTKLGVAAIRRPLLTMATLAIAVVIAGCSGSRVGGPLGTTSQHGYVVSQIALEQVPIGSSKDQVLIALGSPSTTGERDNEAFYYISQTRKQGAAFLPQKVVDQRVLAVYFDQNDNVSRIADYGLKDGKVFDFVSRTTPTAGREENFLGQVLSGVTGIGKNPLGK